ncbi:hypothetical protein D3C81_1483830 [compost metagenome]
MHKYKCGNRESGDTCERGFCKSGYSRFHRVWRGGTDSFFIGTSKGGYRIGYFGIEQWGSHYRRFSSFNESGCAEPRRGRCAGDCRKGGRGLHSNSIWSQRQAGSAAG